MKRGLLYVVFGHGYDELAAHSIAYSRQFTDLPIHVLSNIVSESRHPKWDEIEGVTFTNFVLSQKMNRMIKTQMFNYSPFDCTLYLDCDSVIQKEGIEKIFDLTADGDIVLNELFRWNDGDKIVRLYKKALLKFRMVLPLSVYNGAMICWRNTLKVKSFFSTWNLFWRLTGGGREMPALAGALKRSDIPIKRTWSRVNNLFAPDYRDDRCIIQHDYGQDFLERFGLPKTNSFKPFDNDVTDWNWVEFDE